MLENDNGNNEIDENAPVVTEEELVKFAEEEGLAENLKADAETSSEEEDDAPVSDLTEDEENAVMAGMEALLFMSDRPLSLPKLRSMMGTERKLSVYRALMARLREEFNRGFRGVEIAEFGLGFQLRTKPAMSGVLRKLVKATPLKLTGANMEVMAVVAYKQPLTKDEVDQIRGVDSGYILRTLMEKRLVRIVGRSDLPGRPMLYSTTHEFLELFTLNDLSSLPPLHEVESMVAASEVGDEEVEAQQLSEFGQMVANETRVLFDDSGIDTEIEALRAEIASIPTSTDYIDEQKKKEKLLAQGYTLDEQGNLVPPPGLAPTVEPMAEPSQDYAPSSELLAAAEMAMLERHSEMIQEAKEEAPSNTDAVETVETERPNEPENTL